MDYFSQSFTNIVLSSGKYLRDDHIEHFFELVKKIFHPYLYVTQLQLSDYIEFSLPSSRNNIHILYRTLTDNNLLSGGNWVCSYYDTKFIYIYVSLNEKIESESYKLVLKKLYPYYFEKGKKIIWPTVQLQQECDCGVFAIGFAVSLYFGFRPERVIYDNSNLTMRKFLLYLFKEQIIEHFPFK